jgi:hypothetical protein
MAAAEDILTGIRARLMDTYVIHDNGQCWMWTAACSGVYGVMKVKWPGCTAKRQYAHRISFVLNNLNEFPTYNPEHHISHLCHNTKCINPEHLSHEDPTINRRRENCVETGVCSENHNYKGKTFRKCILGLYINN